MPKADDINACKDVIIRYCQAINEWERLRYILGRVENGQFTSVADRESVAGLTLESHHEAHAKIFDRFILPRDREHGSRPGAPNSSSKDGSFYGVDPQTIRAVEFPAKDRAEIIADWGFQLPGGTIMFVLNHSDGTWRIAHLKLAVDDGWEVAHL